MVREPAYLVWADKNVGKIFSFDAVTSEQHTLTSQLASHPVETGVNIVDNVNQQSDEVTLEGDVSETPIRSFRPGGPGVPPYPMAMQRLALNLPAGTQWEEKSFPIAYPSPSVGALISSGPVGLLYKAGTLATRPTSYTAKSMTGRKTPDVQGAMTLQATQDFDPVADALALLRSAKENASLITLVTPKYTYQSMILSNVTMTRTPDGGAAASFSLTLTNVRIVSSRIVAAPSPSEKRAVTAVNKGVQPPAAPDVGSSIAKGAADGARQVLSNAVSSIFGGK